MPAPYQGREAYLLNRMPGKHWTLYTVQGTPHSTVPRGTGAVRTLFERKESGIYTWADGRVSTYTQLQEKWRCVHCPLPPPPSTPFWNRESTRAADAFTCRVPCFFSTHKYNEIWRLKWPKLQGFYTGQLPQGYFKLWNCEFSTVKFSINVDCVNTHSADRVTLSMMWLRHRRQRQRRWRQLIQYLHMFNSPPPRSIRSWL
jgi:hypothetical protein